MIWLSAISRAVALYRCNEKGAVTVEFVIVFPFVLTLLLTSIDAGITNLRQVFLARAVDLAVREVRLGNVSESARMSELICSRTSMLPSCMQNITVEMRPIDTDTFAGLEDPVSCINRELEITPSVVFTPGTGAQELMLIKVCVAADPFIRLNGFISQMPINASGQYVLITNSVFVNEPR